MPPPALLGAILPALKRIVLRTGAAGHLAKRAGTVAAKWAPYYAAKFLVIRHVQREGIPQVYRVLSRLNRRYVEPGLARDNVQMSLRALMEAPEVVHEHLQELDHHLTVALADRTQRPDIPEQILSDLEHELLRRSESRR
eukprot:g8414.t1